jgi:hypothetical protein
MPLVDHAVLLRQIAGWARLIRFGIEAGSAI